MTLNFKFKIVPCARAFGLILIAAFCAGPAAAQTVVIANETREITVAGDETISTHYQIGNRNTSATNSPPQQALSNTNLTFNISPGVTLTISGVTYTNTNAYLAAGSAINVNVPGNTSGGIAGSPLRFSGGGSLVFSGNEAAQRGGAVGAYFATAGNASVFDFTGLTSLTFSNNIAGNTGYGYGGGLYSSSISGTAATVSGSVSLVTLGNNVTFNNNSAGNAGVGYGGGLYSYGYYSSSVTLGDNVTFSGNTAGNYAGSIGGGGGIYSESQISSSSVTLGNNIIFINNIAGSAGTSGSYSKGGGIAASGYNALNPASSASVTLGNNVTFIGNIAGYNGDGYGGAIFSYGYSNSLVQLGSNVLFQNNRAGGSAAAEAYGGAIFSTYNVSLSGHTLFEGNVTAKGTVEANSRGGAIYLRGTGLGTATLDTTVYDDDGNATNAFGAIAFRNNYSGATVNTNGIVSIEGAIANSIYMTYHIQLLLKGNGNIYFDDPINSGVTQNANNSLVKEGDGFVQFVGNNRLNTEGATGSSVDVRAGTFRLAGGATFNASGGGTFNVAAGATLAGSGTITAGSGGFTISGVISPDNDRFEIPAFDYNTNTFAVDRTTINNAAIIGALSLVGNVVLNSATLMVDLGINTADRVTITGTLSGSGNTIEIQTWALGTFTILTANSGVNANNFTVTYLGQALPSGGRWENMASLSSTNSILTLTTSHEGNLVLYWRGPNDGDFWDIESDYWNETSTETSGETHFVAKDYVIFDNNNDQYGNVQTITVAAGGQEVSGMEIVDGSYIFNAANGNTTIFGVNSAEGSDVTPTGRLLLSTDGTTTLNLATNFVNGTVITGGTLVLGHDQALGHWVAGNPNSTQTGMLLVSDGQATLVVNEDRTITNHIQLGTTSDRTGNLTISIAEGATLTISGVISTDTAESTGLGGAINVNVAGNFNDPSDPVSSLQFTGGGHLVFSGNEAQRYGGAVGAYFSGWDQSSALDFTGLASLTFENNSTTSNSHINHGGGVSSSAQGAYGLSTITMGDNVTFTNNTAANGITGYGGGIYSSAGGNSSVTLGNNVIFSGNIADGQTSSPSSVYGDGGGIYSYSYSDNSSVTLGNNVTFTDNIAGTSGLTGGGGIYSSAGANSSVTLGNNVTFTGNIAGGDGLGAGGGIVSYSFTNNSSVTLGSHVLFNNNRAGGNNATTAQGGAIYSSQDVSLGGHSLFEGNVTAAALDSEGAAIYAAGGQPSTVTLNTTVYDDNGQATSAYGAIAFRNNYTGVIVNSDGTWDTSSGTANSIHLNQNAQLLLMGSGDIYFDDPISSGTDGENSLVKEGEGFVQFVGENRLNTTDFSGNNSVDIKAGTFRVVEGAVFDASGDGAFNVASGAALAGSGTITAGSDGFIISGTISPDGDRFEIPDFDYNTNTFAQGRTEINNDLRVGVLALNGDAILNGITLNVDIVDGSNYDQITVSGDATFNGSTKVNVAGGGANGTYNILAANSVITEAGADFTGQFTGTGADGYSYMRGSSIHLNSENTALQVTLDTTQNIGLTWTGDINTIWSENDTDRNWTDNPGGEANETRFRNGDDVTFDSAYAVPATITVDADGVVIGGMTINNAGDLTFTGGNIGGSGGLSMNGTGKVTLTAFDFSGDIAINSGTLAISAASMGNVLTGSGTLSITLAQPGDSFSFQASAGAGFEGTVAIESGLISLDDPNNYAVLQNASLTLGAEGATTITEDRNIKALTLNGGTISFNVEEIIPEGMVIVEDLTVANNGTVRLDLNKAIEIKTEVDDNLHWYDYSDIDLNTGAHQQLLVLATESASGGLVTWLDYNGNALGEVQVRDITDGSTTIGQATFDYAGSVNVDDTSKELGLYLGYTLTQLEASAGRVIVIDSDEAASAAPTLQAKLTGEGGFSFTGAAGQEVTVGHSQSDYQGPTTVENITLNFLTDNAFGNTNDLTIGAGAGSGAADVDMAGFNQQVGRLTVYEGSSLNLGGGQMTIDNGDDGSLSNSVINGIISGDDGGLLIVRENLTVNSANESLDSNVQITAGTTTMKQADSLGNSGLIELAADAGLIFDMTDDGLLTKNISGQGQLTKTGDATLEIDQANTAFSGAATVAHGILVLSDLAGLGTGQTVTVENDGELQLNQTSGLGEFEKTLTGTGKVTKTGDGTVAITQNGDGYSGLLTVEAGLLQLAGAGSLGEIAVLNSGDGLGLEIQVADDQTRTIQSLTGDGDVTQTGSGQVVLAGNGDLNSLNIYNGTFWLNGGTLATDNGVNVGMSGVSTASFNGTGTVEGPLTINSGSSLNPGGNEAIGALTIDGDLYFNSGAFFVVDVNDINTAESDLVTVTGTAHLAGTVQHIGLNGQYQSAGVNSWTILSAEELDGLFDGVETSFAFLNARLEYENDTVQLVLYRSQEPTDLDGLSRQEQWTKDGIDSLPTGSPVLDGYLNLPDDLEAIKNFLSMTSGEIHASISSVLLLAEQVFPKQMLNQTNQTSGNKVILPVGNDDRVFLWSTLQANQLKLKGDRGAHDLSGYSYGLTLGLETQAFDKWQLGAALRLAQRELDVDDLNSTADIDSLGLGLYAARHWQTSKGIFSLAFGAAHTWHAVETTRKIRTVTYNENVKGDYDARQLQLFTEASLAIETGYGLLWRPHLGLNWNNLQTDRFSERGAAGLRVDKSNDSILSATLGLGLSAPLSERTRVTADLAWQHSFGDIYYDKTMAFTGGADFRMVGAPISRDAALINVGLEASLTDSLNLNIGYSGQLGGNAQVHGGSATLTFSW